MNQVQIIKNDSAHEDSYAPSFISIEDGCENDLVDAIAKARNILAKNKDIDSLNLVSPIVILEFDDDQMPMTTGSPYDYTLQISRSSAYLNGVNRNYGKSQIGVYADNLIADLDQKIEKELVQLTNSTSLIKINKEMEDVFKAFAAGEMTSTDASSECYDAVMTYDGKSAQVKVVGIEWDADDMKDVEGVSMEMILEIPGDIDVNDVDELEDYISDEISNQSGFTHNGWNEYQITFGEKPYTPWEPLENYKDDDFASMVENLKMSVERAFLEAVKLIPLEELEAEVERRKIAEQTVSIASVAPDGATLKDAIASLPKTSNPTLKA